MIFNSEFPDDRLTPLIKKWIIVILALIAMLLFIAVICALLRLALLISA